MRLKPRNFSIGAASLRKNKRNIVAGLTLNRVLEHLFLKVKIRRRKIIPSKNDKSTVLRPLKKFRRHIYEYSYLNCFENSIYEKS